MKSSGIIHILLFVIVILASKCCHAQDYLVTSKGDTLFGQVRPLTYGVDKKVQFTAEGKKKTVYPMFQVRSFRYKDEIYKPVKGPEGYTFMKLVRSGYLSLYNYQLPNQASYDGSFLLRKDGEGIDVPNLSFKKYMKNFLEDCPTIVGKIDNGDLGRKDLEQIIDEYNACIDGKTIDHDQVIAEKSEQKKVLSAWDVLLTKVTSQPDFEGKDNAMEMIQEIKRKITNTEKIPNFLLEGVRSILKQEELKVELENALNEIK